MPWNRVLAAGDAAGLAALAGRMRPESRALSGRGRSRVEERLSDLGGVDEVSILPLVERLIPEGTGLTGEPGVSYLIRAGGMRVLFWPGYVTEQALVVNVRGFGLVLVSGCGHPRIEQILG